MTARLLIDACGLSQREAAEFLGVRLDTVKSWYRVHPTAARPGIIHELQALHVKQRRAAANFINLTRKLARDGHTSDAIEVGIASDDAEARSLGWPCVGAQRMAIAMAAARIKDFRIITVTRGTTFATAAAADAIARTDQNGDGECRPCDRGDDRHAAPPCGLTIANPLIERMCNRERPPPAAARCGAVAAPQS